MLKLTRLKLNLNLKRNWGFKHDMYNKEAKKRLGHLYSLLAFELDLIQKRKDMLDLVNEVIDSNQFDEEWEKILISLETPKFL